MDDGFDLDSRDVPLNELAIEHHLSSFITKVWLLFQVNLTLVPATQCKVIKLPNLAGPSIMARVELSGLSGDEVLTQANLTNLTKIFIQILPAILTSDAHISAQPNDTSLHQTSCIQYITVHRRKSVLNTSLIHQVKTPANAITLNYQVSLTP